MLAPGLLAVTNQPVGNLPAGCQVIIRRPLDGRRDPLYEVEHRGRRASVHASEMDALGVGWD